MRKFKSPSRDFLLGNTRVSDFPADRPPPPCRPGESQSRYPIGADDCVGNGPSSATAEEARLSRQSSVIKQRLRRIQRKKSHRRRRALAREQEKRFAVKESESASDRGGVFCSLEAPVVDWSSETGETITVSESSLPPPASGLPPNKSVSFGRIQGGRKSSSPTTDHTNERLETTSQRRSVHQQQTRPRRQSAHDASPTNAVAATTPRLEVYANDLLNETRLSSELLNERVRAACSNLPKNITTGFLLSTPASRIVAASISVGTFDFLYSENETTVTTNGTKAEEEVENKGSMTLSAKRSRSAQRQASSVQQLKRSSKFGNALAPMLTEQLGFAAQMGKTRKETVAGMKLASENGLVFKSQLKDKEYVFLNASEFGEVEIVRELLTDRTLNVDCVDYMGRNAVLLAMKTENIELIDCLVGRLNFYAVEDALLNAISQEKIHIVKLIIDHPQYIRMEKIMTPRGQRAGIITKSIERSQFSSDITPLMLAAHTNNHEIIQLLLDRGLKVEMPHDRSCLCLDCESIRAQDSLILEMQRLHTYQALTSSAYLALTTSDPVSSAFVLRGELYQLASQEKQFKEEYSRLAVQSMNFAVSCLDLCRTSDEVHCLLTGSDASINGDAQCHLATIKQAVQCREKKFVAHSNCQHQLENLFYDCMFCIRDFEGIQRLQFFLIFIPLLPILYIIYLFFPNLKIPLPQNLMFRHTMSGKLQVSRLLRCPIVKFIGHMLSYFTFLLLITVATFRLDKDDESEEEDLWKIRSYQVWSYDFRTSQRVMTKIQTLLLFWILGQLFGECKQVYHYGLQHYFRSYYNIMDWASVSLYLGAYALRILVDIKVYATETVFRQRLLYAQALLHNASDILTNSDISSFELTQGAHQQIHYVGYRNALLREDSAYWLRGCRLWWSPDDPEYVSDCLFALANVLSFARISYLMPAWELLGPLQISLARMVSDIIRFMALFSVMLIAFVVGLTNLYWYFAKMIVSIDTGKGTRANGAANIHYASGIPAFQSSTATFYTLFWALFGQSSNNVTTIEENLASVYPGHVDLRVDNSSFMITSLGSILYAIYNACMIIILLNMLIAMMSKSFDEIQGDRLEEWKFARANLWIVYIEQEGVLPAPLNLLPSRVALTKISQRTCKALRHCMCRFLMRGSRRPKEDKVYLNQSYSVDSSGPMIQLDEKQQWTAKEDNRFSSRKNFTPKDEDHLTRVKCNIMRRYLFQLQKQKEAENKSGDLAMLNMQRQQQIQVTPIQSDKEHRAVINEGSGFAANAARSEGANINSPVKETSADDTGSPSPFSRSLARSCKRGLSSLLMPPSVRRKLEAVAVGEMHGDIPATNCEAEATARYLLLETTRQTRSAFPSPRHTGRTYDPGSFDSQFTARTEKPLKDTHLRELYKVEQEMHDMSDALSSISFSTSSLSEVDELEVTPSASCS
nr:unnamed protein product [Spirometra erinaceieuropaei]